MYYSNTYTYTIIIIIIIIIISSSSSSSSSSSKLGYKNSKCPRCYCSRAGLKQNQIPRYFFRYSEFHVSTQSSDDR